MSKNSARSKPQDLIQPELLSSVIGKIQNAQTWLVGLIGLEPMTLRLSSACSNQLSYRPKESVKN